MKNVNDKILNVMNPRFPEWSGVLSNCTHFHHGMHSSSLKLPVNLPVDNTIALEQCQPRYTMI